VYAIGEPPKDKLCLFRNMKNVVVLPSKGITLPLLLVGDHYSLQPRRKVTGFLPGRRRLGRVRLKTTAFLILTAISNSDLYDIIFHGPLLPTEHIDPALYPDGNTRENPGGRPSTVEDICDFIVEYIHSDVLVGTNTRFRLL
jgi:RNA-dependent RNA polymerase